MIHLYKSLDFNLINNQILSKFTLLINIFDVFLLCFDGFIIRIKIY